MSVCVCREQTAEEDEMNIQSSAAVFPLRINKVISTTLNTKWHRGYAEVGELICVENESDHECVLIQDLVWQGCCSQTKAKLNLASICL